MRNKRSDELCNSIYQLEGFGNYYFKPSDVANRLPHSPEEILEALTLAEEDPAVHFILINANGKVFSVGEI